MMEVQQLMEELVEAVAAGMSRAFLWHSSDNGVITQEDHQWEQWTISNITVSWPEKIN